MRKGTYTIIGAAAIGAALLWPKPVNQNENLETMVQNVPVQERTCPEHVTRGTSEYKHCTEQQLYK